MRPIRVEQAAGGSVVVLSGDIDVNCSDELEQTLSRAGEAAPNIAVDLAAVTLLDSRAIGILLGWSERLRAIDGGLALVAASPDVRRLFATIGLDREFEFYESREEALPKEA